MGEKVEARQFTREDRQRYREKVQRCLDALARMLTDDVFSFADPAWANHAGRYYRVRSP